MGLHRPVTSGGWSSVVSGVGATNNPMQRKLPIPTKSGSSKQLTNRHTIHDPGLPNHVEP